MPLVVAGDRGPARDALLDGMAGLLPADAERVAVAPDDDFGWLPEAVELGWRRERADPALAQAGPADLVPWDPGRPRPRDPDGVTGARARIVVRALALGYGLLATMTGGGLDDVLDALGDPAIGTDGDERRGWAWSWRSEGPTVRRA